MVTLSVASSDASEVVKALRAYLEESVPSDFTFPENDAEKPHQWQASGTIFVDFTPLTVQACVNTCGETTSVSVNHPSHSDTVRFNSMCKELVGSLQERGLQVSANFPTLNFQPRLLDDDDFEDSDEEDEEPAWDERVLPLLEDTTSIRKEVREEAFRAIAQWATSNPATHEALAKGFVDRAVDFSSLFSTSSKAGLAETYPFAIAMRKLSEGFLSMATCEKMLNSPLSAMMEPGSKPGVPAVVVREYNRAMKALGKTEISEPSDDIYAIPDLSVKSKVISSPQFEASKVSIQGQVFQGAISESNLVLGQ